MMNAKRGFSLIEASVAIALFSLLFILIFEIMVNGRIFWERGSLNSDIKFQARQGMAYMTRDLYRTSPSKIDLIPGVNSPQTTFQVPIGYGPTGDIAWGAQVWSAADGRFVGRSGFSIRFYVDNANRTLIREIWDNNAPPATLESRVIAKDVERVSFTLASLYPTSPTILLSISLVTQRDILGKGLSHTQTATIRLRNN